MTMAMSGLETSAGARTGLLVCSPTRVFDSPHHVTRRGTLAAPSLAVRATQKDAEKNVTTTQHSTNGTPQNRALRRRSPTREALSPWARTFSSLWDPLAGPHSLRQLVSVMDRLFNELTPSGMQELSWASGQPGRTPWAVRELDGAFEIRMDVPGLSKEDVKVQVEDGRTLVIRGEKHAKQQQQQQGEGGDDWTASHAVYHTRIELPDIAMTEEIKAELKDGVLNVKVPKAKAEEKAHVVDVPVH